MVDLNEIRLHIREELKPGRERGKYICPLCGSGTGARGTAAFSIDKDGIHGKCFSCNWYGDLFDLISARDNVDLQEATRKAIDRYSSAADRRRPSEASTGRAMSWDDSIREDEAPPPAAAAPTVLQDQPSTGAGRDLRSEILAFHQQLSGSAGEAYLTGRGFTMDTMERFVLGYDPQRQQVIIPYDRDLTYYGMRNIAPDARRSHDKPAGIDAPLYNAGAMYGDGDHCFVVEAPLCAISIMQAGGAALALGGTNTRLLEAAILKQRPAVPLVLCLDNDQPKEDGRRPGQEAQAQLAAWLKAQGIPFFEANIAGEHKDPNEALQADPEAFARRIRETLQGIQGTKEQQEQEKLTAYLGESAAGFVDAFLDGVSASADTPPIPTGFYGLDKLLEGGLYEGLYVVGAISSLGKTSFVLQLCDQIAAAGHDVLFFSLEMGRYELMAKSISRLTLDIVRDRGLSVHVAKTTRGILTGKRYEKYNQTELGVIEEAITRYRSEISGRIWFIEGIGNIGTAEIRLQAEKHVHMTGRRPVVVVDYMQILAPSDVRASDKQNTDKNVLELKRLSRDLKLPVIGISSLNRDNYQEPINTAAFKESGAIEYGADCLIGLQYLGMDYEEGEAEKARMKRIREIYKDNERKAREGKGVEIQVKILKNRNGGKGTSDPLEFVPMFNSFREHPEGSTIANDEDNPFSAAKKRRTTI